MSHFSIFSFFFSARSIYGQRLIRAEERKSFHYAFLWGKNAYNQIVTKNDCSRWARVVARSKAHGPKSGALSHSIWPCGFGLAVHAMPRLMEAYLFHGGPR
jgi:hypothetical protein